jgi:hypothetical protein
MGLKFYWFASEAIIATVIATVGIGEIYYVHPDLFGRLRRRMAGSGGFLVPNRL